MIYVDRNVVPRPEVLDPTNPRLAKEMEEATRYYSEKEQNRAQRRFRFRAIFQLREVKEALQKLFHGKCAYCESKMSHNGRQDLEHYRPVHSVLEDPDHPGYWWLAHNWDNMLITCPTCNGSVSSKSRQIGKRNRFPLKDKKERAYSPKAAISKEHPLILNPCINQPEEHLMYNDDGEVISDTEEGKTSILVLGLNRPELITSRQAVIAEIKKYRRQLVSVKNSIKISKTGDFLRIQKILVDLTDDSQEFAGLKRQFVKEIFDHLKLEAPESASLESTAKVTQKQKKKTRADYEIFSQNIGNISVGEAMDQGYRYTLMEHNVSEIELTNIKTFKKNTFALTASQSTHAPWLMLLGENGTGKSTVLKSLCLNLCDGNYFLEMIRQNLVNPTSFIRYGTRKGTIKVWMTTSDKPRILEFRKNSVKFTNSGGKSVEFELPLSRKKPNVDIWKTPSFLLAYGATRLLPRGSKYEAKHIDSEVSRMDNLFNPFVPLVDAESWLLQLDKRLFRRAAIVMKDLLQMTDAENITRRGKKLSIMINGMQESFKELSDGYQSVIALTADVLKLAMKKYEDPDEARGIVLLDEVGAHLHPRWKMRIVTSLRKALPHMQFIVSTHQPLCLRGLEKGEVILMRRDQDREIEIVTNLPDPKGLRISQILTSVFGLSSTMDPELEKGFNRYYELRAKNELTLAEIEEMKDLREVLNPDLMLGETVLETQVYNVIKEKYEHYKEEGKLEDLEALSEETKSAARALWRSTT